MDLQRVPTAKVCSHLFACSSSFMMSMLMALSSPSPSGTCTWYGESGTHVAMSGLQGLRAVEHTVALYSLASARNSTSVLWTCINAREPPGARPCARRHARGAAETP